MNTDTALTAGRELDARVAERVMALTGPFRVYSKQLWRQITPDAGGEQAVPRYSDDIAAAWQVVEFFLHSDRVAREYEVVYDVFHQRWGAKLNIHELDEDDLSKYVHRYEATADTAPLAICLAALKWADSR